MLTQRNLDRIARCLKYGEPIKHRSRPVISDNCREEEKPVVGIYLTTQDFLKVRGQR